jgi:HAD superfamily hydrolase (TIGR01459 family)
MAFSKTSIEFLMDQFDVFILDVWGVIHDGFTLYPGVLETLERLSVRKKEVLFLSNAPRPAPVIRKKLLDLNIKVAADRVLTSGDVVREQLEQFNDVVFSTLGKKFYHLGELRNQDILAGLAVQTVDTIEKAHFVLLTAYLDEDEDLQQFIPFFEKIRALNLPVICANPDGEIINGDKLRYCSGYFAKQYEAMGGTVYYYGKPYQNVYIAALKRLNLGNDKKRILMVGDTLETDIQGGLKAKIDTALVQTGNTNILLKKHEISVHHEAEFLSQLFEKMGITPHWVIPSFGLA